MTRLFWFSFKVSKSDQRSDLGFTKNNGKVSLSKFPRWNISGLVPCDMAWVGDVNTWQGLYQTTQFWGDGGGGFVVVWFGVPSPPQKKMSSDSSFRVLYLLYKCPLRLWNMVIMVITFLSFPVWIFLCDEKSRSASFFLFNICNLGISQPVPPCVI